MQTTTKVIVGLSIAALATRLLPHYPNFTAVGALAFFTAWKSRNTLLSLVLMTGVMMISDIIINNLIYPTGEFLLMYPGSIYTYLGFATYGIIGRISPKNTKGLFGIIAGSISFFLLSNLGVWLNPINGYPANLTGLLTSYTAAIPFYAPELLSTFLFSGAAVGATLWMSRTAEA